MRTDHSTPTKTQRIEAAMATLKRAFMTAREDLTQGFQLTRTQFEILLMFSEQPVWTIGELANRLGLTPSAVTQTVDTLVRRDLVARHPDETDRRIIRLGLAAAGEELTDHLRALRQTRTQALADSLTAAETDAFIAATQKFAAVLQQKL
jgi:DNA-binding MarR family transcriptional regulator